MRLAPYFAAAVLAATPALAEVTVFAAASLKTALDEVAADWTEKTGVNVLLSYGGTPTLARQIEAGAPADIFFSAAGTWMDYLQDRKLIRPETRRDILGNRLVLISSTSRAASVKLDTGAKVKDLLGDERLSMALVDAVPAGQYGKEALMSLGVWDAVKDQVIQSENVTQALRLVATGEVAFGIVYMSDLVGDGGAVKLVGSFPEDSHRPIVYPAALTADDAGPEAAAVLDYLAEPAAIAVFQRNRFVPVAAGRAYCGRPLFAARCADPAP